MSCICKKKFAPLDSLNKTKIFTNRGKEIEKITQIPAKKYAFLNFDHLIITPKTQSLKRL